MLLTQPALGEIEGFTVIAEVGGGPAVFGMLPEWVGVVVILVDRQRQRQIAVQLVKDVPLETLERQLVCAGFAKQANEHFFQDQPPGRILPFLTWSQITLLNF